MKPLTPKQRREIYLKAAELFGNKKNFNKSLSVMERGRFGMCSAFSKVLRVGSLKEFEEIMLFSNGIYWFPYTNEGDKCRVICLLLAYEMTKTAKQ